MHLKELEKEQQSKPKVSRRKEIRIRTEINEVESAKMIQRINESKSCFFEKLNKIDQPLTILIKKKKRKDPNK